MGWTLFACFGCTKKRKRPKKAYKLGSKTKRRSRARGRGYEALQTDEVLQVLELSEPLSSPREKPKEEAKARISKKVRFDLNVVTYEPLSSQDEEDDKTGRTYAPLSKTISSTESKLPLYPSDHRYNNCYDGEDEYENDDDDHDDDDDSQISDDENEDDYKNSKMLYYDEIDEGDLHDCSSKPLISSATNARLRSRYIVPVLNPIENLSQWKALKIRKC